MIARKSRPDWQHHSLIAGRLMSEAQDGPVDEHVHWFWPRPQRGDEELLQFWPICEAADRAAETEPDEGLLCHAVGRAVTCSQCAALMDAMDAPYDLPEPFCAVLRGR